MNNFNHKLLILFSLSSFWGIAQAEAEAEEILDIPISFSKTTDFRDVACNGGPRKVVYHLKNTEANTINLDNIHVITNNTDNATNLTITFDTNGANNCITTTYSDNTIGQGSIPGFSTGGECKIKLTVTPPKCPANGVLHKTIDRQLFIGVETREQNQLTAEIDAAVSVIGSGANFALLTNNPTSGKVANASTYGAAQINGDVGSNSEATTSDFQVTNGHFYNTQSSSPNHIYTAAGADFLAAYNQLLTSKSNLGCNHINGLSNESKGPGYYCFSNSTTPIIVEGTITLTGPDANGIDYFFFLESADNLTFDANVEFLYPNGSTPANVFWIIGDSTTTASGQVLIHGGARVDGTILSGANLLTTPTAPAITTTAAGSSRAQVNGSLWSAAPQASNPPNSTIQLYGDSVAVNN